MFWLGGGGVDGRHGAQGGAESRAAAVVEVAAARRGCHTVAPLTSHPPSSPLILNYMYIYKL